MPCSRFVSTLVSVAFLLFLAVPAVAQDRAVAAEALFNQGRKLMEAKSYDEACEKFAASQKLDPATGTLLNLANCYEKGGKLASAWATFKEAAARARDAGQKGREGHARSQAERIEGALAELTVRVKDDHEGAVEVSVGGIVQDPALWGSAVPVDAGKLEIVAKAPNRKEWSRTIEVVDGESYVVEVPPLSEELVPGAAEASVAGTEAADEVEELQQDPAHAEQDRGAAEATRPDPPPPEADTGARRGTGQRVAGWLLFSAGAATTIVGGVFGVKAIIDNTASDENCDTDNVCDSDGFEARTSARQAGNLSTGLMIGGGVLATAGVVLVITAPKGSRVGWSPRPGGGSLFFQSTF